MNSLIRRKPQAGASLVEMSLTISIFIILILAIIEFSLMLFVWARSIEATRIGARYAAVNNPVISLAGLNCQDNSNSFITTDCSSSGCASLLSRMRSIMPDLQGNQVEIRYACSRTGNPDRPASMMIAEISVSIVDLEFYFMSPGMFGLQPSVAMPRFTAVRTAEDMHTP